ncbi:MAG: transcriptional repressor [Opitutaceae bacterium]|jgi:Fur family ferric uptake transcriptional regulator|nr:transcriptional repressor [Opitutaceae bacterium]
MIALTQTNHPIASLSADRTSQSSIDFACSRLKASGLRITQPRIAILSSLIQRPLPASIEQIHGDLPPDTCDLVTVYRCLSVFQEIGLVRLSYFHNGTSAYQLTLNNEEPPYHVICRDTGKIEELDAASAAELRAVLRRIEETLRIRGHEGVSHIAEFFVGKSKLAGELECRRVAAEVLQTIHQRAQSAVPVP